MSDDIPGIIPQRARVSYVDEPALPPVRVSRIEPGTSLMYQPFEVRGLKRIYRATPERAQEWLKIMSDQMAAYFAVSPPVKRWRREPEFDVWEDFEHDARVILVSARGWFDVLTTPDNVRPRYDILGE